MIRAGVYELDMVLPHIGTTETIILDGDVVGVNSLRMNCFKVKGLACVTCGIEGKFFAKEKSSPKDGQYHLNLYGINPSGREILMTKDHILARSKGGRDRLDNLQTMCAPCNVDKGNGDPGGGNQMKSIKTGVERIDTLLGNLACIIQNRGKLVPADLNDLIKHVRDTLTNSITTHALDSVAPGRRPEDSDPYNTRVFEIAPNVVIAAPPIKDGECHKFYVLNLKTGERLSITAK